MINKISNINQIPGFNSVFESICNGVKSVSVSGMVGSSRTLLAAWIYQKTNKPLFFISPDQESSENVECGASSDNLAYVRIETDQGPRMVRRYQVDLGSNITPPPCPCQIAQATEARNASSSGLGSPLCNRQVKCVWGK